jgi:hypothetical protein
LAFGLMKGRPRGAPPFFACKILLCQQVAIFACLPDILTYKYLWYLTIGNAVYPAFS